MDLSSSSNGGGGQQCFPDITSRLLLWLTERKGVRQQENWLGANALVEPIGGTNAYGIPMSDYSLH